MRSPGPKASNARRGAVTRSGSGERELAEYGELADDREEWKAYSGVVVLPGGCGAAEPPLACELNDPYVDDDDAFADEVGGGRVCSERKLAESLWLW